MTVSSEPKTALRIRLQGRVQGVGLRPIIARLAHELSLAGFVANTSEGIVIHLEGSQNSLSKFEHRLSSALPETAGVHDWITEAASLRNSHRFEIVDSQDDGPLAALIPPDVAICDQCLLEIRSDSNRRQDYAFTTCACCGPRYSVLNAMPFDRERTSMAIFAMCPACHSEYLTCKDRRFHAQTITCPECGPSLHTDDDDSMTSLMRAMQVIQSGGIVALCGLGGYQLAVDATNEAAVVRLRQRKRRETKPFAVMVRDLAQADHLASLTDQERALLSSSARPIVLIRVRRDALLAAGIHPGLSSVGLLLPTTPLHVLLLDQLERPLVMTSGNLEGDPLVADSTSARRELAAVADLFLHHNRPIVRPIDDSVVRVIADQPVTLRNARGLTPTPLLCSFTINGPPIKSHVLALGGHQKNAIALFNGSQSVLGPHLGDLESLASRQRFTEHVSQMRSLYQCRPQLIVHDRHPDYFSTHFARALERESSITGSSLTHQTPPPALLAVQHHHAHVVSAMIDNKWLDREVLGVAFDGTGWGDDGTIWGGEFLKATVNGCERVGHLTPFPLPGGEAAIREPYRIALSLLAEACGIRDAERLVKATTTSRPVEPEIFQHLVRIVQSPALSPVTTSAGRLFDGVAALLLNRPRAAFDGELPMLLEAVANPAVTDAYAMTIVGGVSLLFDWRPMLRAIVHDLEGDVPRSVIAMKFHRGLARGVVAMCRAVLKSPLRNETFTHPWFKPLDSAAPLIVLTGGVFQNRLLTELILAEWPSDWPRPGLHSAIPPNDGGLAAGQLAIGMSSLKHQKQEN